MKAMKMSGLLFACILMTCSVWTVHGRYLVIDLDDNSQMEEEMSVDESKLPGLCWVCKWALNKVKKSVGPNATAEELTNKVSSICDKIGLLKSQCRKFVKRNLGELVEELSTTDDVRTICVNLHACKPKELSTVFIDGVTRIQVAETN